MEHAYVNALRHAHRSRGSSRFVQGAVTAGGAAATIAYNAMKRAWIETKWQARILPQAVVRDAFRTATREVIAQPIRTHFRSRNYMPYKRSYRSVARRSYRKPYRKYKRSYKAKRYGAVRRTARRSFKAGRGMFGTAGSRLSTARMRKGKVSRAFSNLRFQNFTT